VKLQDPTLNLKIHLILSVSNLKRLVNYLSTTDNLFRQFLGESISKSIQTDTSQLPVGWFYNVRKLLVEDDLGSQFGTELNYLLTDEQGSPRKIPIAMIYMAAEFGTFTNLIVSLRESWVYSHSLDIEGLSTMPEIPNTLTTQDWYQRKLPEGIVTCPAAKLMMFYMNLFHKCNEDPALWQKFTQEGSAERLIDASSMFEGGVEWFFY
jgi:hypothetical protein